MDLTHLTITRGRNRDAQPIPDTPSRGLAVLLVGLSIETRTALVAGTPLHLRVPIGGDGLLELVLVPDDAAVLPPAIAHVLDNAAAVVQITDTEQS